MEKKFNTTLKLSELKFEKELYPRVGVNNKTAYFYSQAMLSGAKFPPITVAVFKNKKIVVDGMHRIEAHKILKEDTIEAEVIVGWDEKKIFEEAIRRNTAHGIALNPYEKRLVALRLRKLKYSDDSISSLINVPVGKLENFIGQRLINTITGKQVTSETVVKSGLKHLAGQSFGEERYQEIQDTQEDISIGAQLKAIKDVVNLLGEGLIDVGHPKIHKQLMELKSLLNELV